jgi:hypothetical protein
MNLFYHVAYKPIDAAEKGLMMPAMRFMTEGDAGALWQWLRAIATTPMPPYATKAGGAKAAAALTPPVWPSKPAAMTPPKH